MTLSGPHIVVIDPGLRHPELDSLNRLSLAAKLPVSYHLPAMFGLGSLSLEDMTQVRGLVIFGSASSVNDRFPWQIDLENFLRPHIASGIPTLGLCYGHQMLAYMFGGRIDFAWEDRHKAVGQRVIELSDGLIWSKSKGPVVVSHCEAVVDVPKDFEVVGSSSEVQVEALRHRSLPLWSFQSHPEATKRFLLSQGVELTTESLKFGHQLVQGFLDYTASQDRTQ